MSEPSVRADRWGKGTMWMAIAAVAALAGIAILLASDRGSASPGGTQVSSAGVAAPAAADRATPTPETFPRTIQVTGGATFEVAPDRAVFTAGVERDAETADGARRQASQAIGEVIAALRAAGVPEERLQSNGLQVEPRYDDDSGNVTSFRAGADVVVTIDDLERVGATIDAAGQAGANRIESVDFTLKDPGAVQRDALARAAADGRAQADALAEGAGVQVGEVISISGSGDSPVPYESARAAAPAADSQATVVAPGTLSGRVSVSMSFAIA